MDLEAFIKITVVVFMVGNLLDIGLRLELSAALAGLRNTRFLVAILLWGFVLLPVAALLLVAVLPLSHSHATGLILLSLAPCAPFLPPMVDRAKGDLTLAAVALLVTAVVTVAWLPFAIPLLVHGLDASAATIARPLVLFLLLPLFAGMLVRRLSPSLAERLHPPVKQVTGIDTILMLVLCVWAYGHEFLSLRGSYVIGAQLLFFTLATVGPYLLGFGADRSSRVVLSLAMATRNLGAAMAPIFAVQPADRQAIATVALGVVSQTIFAFAAATVFGRGRA